MIKLELILLLKHFRYIHWSNSHTRWDTAAAHAAWKIYIPYSCNSIAFWQWWWRWWRLWRLLWGWRRTESASWGWRERVVPFLCCVWRAISTLSATISLLEISARYYCICGTFFLSYIQNTCTRQVVGKKFLHVVAWLVRPAKLRTIDMVFADLIGGRFL